MTPEERALKPIEYMLVNYFKSNSEKSLDDIDYDLKFISYKTIRKSIKMLEKLNVIEIDRTVNNTRPNIYKVKDQSEWIVH